MKEAKVWFSKTVVWNMKYFGNEYMNYVFDALEHYYIESWDEFFMCGEENIAKYESDTYNPIYIWNVNNELRIIVDADIPDNLRWTITVMKKENLEKSMYKWR